MARELTVLVNQRGKPGMIVSDNGTEFTCNAMLASRIVLVAFFHTHRERRVRMSRIDANDGKFESIR